MFVKILKNMIKKIFLVFIFCSNFIFSQYEIKIEASVLDYNTSKPISLASVNFKFTKIGAFTNNTGKFNLTYDEKLIKEDDIFEINAKGFKSLEIKVTQLYKFLRNTDKFYLQREDKNNSWANDILKRYLNFGVTCFRYKPQHSYINCDFL